MTIAIGTKIATNGMPMMVMASAIDATMRNGTKKISAAKPMMAARMGSAAAARPTRATGARATMSISAISTASTENAGEGSGEAEPIAELAEAAEREARGNHAVARRDHSPKDT